MKRIITTFCAAAGMMTFSHAQTALDFDGVGDHVVIANEANFDFTTTMTVEFWVKVENFDLLDGLVTKGDNSWRIHLENDGTVLFAGNNAFPDFGSTTAVNDGIWHHVAATYDGVSAKIYIDGVEENAYAATAPISNGNFQVAFGENLQAFGRFLQGQMDNIRIWNVARSATEIANSMDCEVTPNTTGLIAAYHFNDGIEEGTNTSNTTLFDNSGNGNHGTLQNFALTGTTSNFVASNRTNYMSIQAAIGSSAMADRMVPSEPADFNGDGFDDIIVATEAGARDIYYSDGFGHFEAAVPVPNTIGGAFAVGDIDNDGDVDLVNYAGTDFKVYVNDGAGNFTEQTAVSIDGTGNISVARIADVNGDNLADIVTGNGGTAATDLNEIWINSGTVGNPSFTFLEGLNSSYAPINGIAIGDIDSDGDVDLAFGGGSWPAVVFNNDNNTTFVQGQSIGGYNGYPRFIDWNQDGHLDFVNNDGYNNWGVRVRYNDGTGNFLANTEVIVAIANGINYFSYWPVEYTDMNGDGFLDVISRHWGGNGEIFLSNGCIVTDQTTCDYKLGPADNGVKTGDFNGDGKPDVFCGARDRKSSASLNFLTPVITPALSDITSTTGDEVCDGDQISIEATASNTGTIQWFSDVNGSTLIGTGSPYSPIAGPGTYEYYVGSENPNGCRSLLDTVEVVVNENPNASLNTTTSVTELDCFGDTDGELNVDVTLNGTATSSTYEWDDASNSTTQNLTGVGAGTYSMTLTDNNGCTATASGTITEPTELVTTAAITSLYNGQDVSCNGATDGEITLSATGGTTGYTFAWDDASNSTTQNLTGIGAGTYNVDVTDANGCISTASATVTEPDALVGTATATEVSCNGDTDGEVTLTVTGGTTTYSFAWDDASSSTTQDLNGLGAGTYNVGITDVNGCTSTASATVTEPDELVGTATATEVSCNGDTDGEVTLTVTGGTTTYSFAWDDASSSTTQDLTDVGAGTYNVDITDVNGCTSSASATVTEPDAIGASATTTDETLGADGSIDLTVSGGTTPFSYDWTGPNGFTSTDQNPTDLVGGTYEVTITDDNGCTFTLEVIVDSTVGLTENAKMNFSVYPNPTNGLFTIDSPVNASLDVINTNGQIIYATTIPNGKTEHQLTQLAQGVYSVRLTTEYGVQLKRLVIQ